MQQQPRPLDYEDDETQLARTKRHRKIDRKFNYHMLEKITKPRY